METKNKQNKTALKCAVCGDAADLTAALDSSGAPIWGLRDEGGFWGGASPCGDWHRWEVEDD